MLSTKLCSGFSNVQVVWYFLTILRPTTNLYSAMKSANVDDRQMRLLQEMLKFSKNGDKILSSPSPVLLSPPAKLSSSSVKEKPTPVVNQTPKKTANSSADVHFSGSAFLSSPDPSTIPMPEFEEEYFPASISAPIANSAKASKAGTQQDTSKGSKISPTSSYSQIVKKNEEAPVVQDKTEALKRFLKVRRT